jgi:hypothetical protein
MWSELIQIIAMNVLRLVCPWAPVVLIVYAEAADTHPVHSGENKTNGQPIETSVRTSAVAARDRLNHVHILVFRNRKSA